MQTSSTRAGRADIESSPLYNRDLAPTVLPGEAASGDRGARIWGTYNYAALWVSMSVNILTYMLAASLIQGGMNWKQAVATIFLGFTPKTSPWRPAASRNAPSATSKGQSSFDFHSAANRRSWVSSVTRVAVPSTTTSRPDRSWLVPVVRMQRGSNSRFFARWLPAAGSAYKPGSVAKL